MAAPAENPTSSPPTRSRASGSLARRARELNTGLISSVRPLKKDSQGRKQGYRSARVRTTIRSAAVLLAALAFVSGCGGNGDSAAPAGPKTTTAGHEDGGDAHPVAGNFEPDETRLEDCAGDFACLEQAFGNLAYREG